MLWALAVLIAAGAVQTTPPGSDAAWTPRLRPATEVDVVIICDWGNDMVGRQLQWRLPESTRVPAYAGIPSPPHPPRFPFAAVPSHLVSSRTTGFISAPAGSLRFKPLAARGCRPVVVMHGVAGR